MPAHLENALAPTLSLDGDWTFSLAGSLPKTVPVPSAWEAHVIAQPLDRLGGHSFSYTEGCRILTYYSELEKQPYLYPSSSWLWSLWTIGALPIVHKSTAR